MRWPGDSGSALRGSLALEPPSIVKGMKALPANYESFDAREDPEQQEMSDFIRYAKKFGVIYETRPSPSDRHIVNVYWELPPANPA